MEGYWTGLNSTFQSQTWAIILTKDILIGHIEEVTVVWEDDQKVCSVEVSTE